MEGITVGEEALGAVAALGAEVSLRYALQLLTPANVLARVGGRKEVNGQDIAEARELFLDARRSAGILKGVGGGEFIV